jgi:hypothetical protein
MEGTQAFRMVARLSLVMAALALKFATPTPVQAGGCFKCEGGNCWEAHPASSGFIFCNGDGVKCVASCSCG